MKGKVVISCLLALFVALQMICVPAFAAEDEPAVLLDSALTDGSDLHEVSGFELVNWAWGQCGYSSARNIYTNNLKNTTSIFMTFDAGEGKAFTTAQFQVTVHASSEWHIVQREHFDKFLFASNDGEIWTPVTSGTYGEKDTNQADGANYYTYPLTWEIPDGARYLKLDGTRFINNFQFFVHHATLYGNAAKPTPLLDSALTDDSDLHKVSGFKLVDWAHGRCGYESVRNIYSNTSTNGYLVFDAGEGKAFTSAQFQVTAHASSKWLITDAGQLNDMLMISDNGQSWTPVGSGSYAEKSTNYDGATAYYTYELIWEIPDGVRYLKLDGTGFTNYQLFVHHATLYGGDTAEDEALYFSTVPSVEKGTESWTVSGTLENTGASLGDIFVVFGIYEETALKSVGIEKIAADTGRHPFAIAADVQNTDGQTLETKLFVWSADGLTPLLSDTAVE